MPAIYYQPEAYTTDGPRLMGRNSAGESFLRGYLTHATASEFWVQVEDIEHARRFVSTAEALGRYEPVKAVTASSLSALSDADLVFHPGPGIGEPAWHRSLSSPGAWSLCGITHTLCSAGAMNALADLTTAPVQPWDALICTSAAAKENVTCVLDAQHEYLANRLGATKRVLPQLPVIPLGINTEDFSFSAAQRAAARQSLGIDEQTLVVLFFGRLSFHAKAHPLAMYQAVETAMRTTGRTVTLIECGWFASDQVGEAYAEAAELTCPSARVITLDGRSKESRLNAWAAADVFCSLADNIQETFGITPVEAMAAGLPVVVSDWDGYRDTVRDGIDGFRIPTTMPMTALGADLAFRHALGIDTYDMYCGLTSSLVAVDIDAAAHAFIRLFESQELRRKMGEAARQRARDVFDWGSIIPQYEGLWAVLNEIRQCEAPKLKPVRHPWPARLEPFHAFSSYPTQRLDMQTVLHLVDADLQDAIKRTLSYRQLVMVGFAEDVIPTEEEIRSVLAVAASGPKPAFELVAAIPHERKIYVFRGLAWLMKLGILKT